jgi:hypothetical protein
VREREREGERERERIGFALAGTLSAALHLQNGVINEGGIRAVCCGIKNCIFGPPSFDK